MKKIAFFREFLQQFWNAFQKFLKPVQKFFADFNERYPNTSQKIQLSFVYFFAIVDLFYSILNNVFSLGYYPEIIMPFYPIIEAILLSPLLRIWASPEKVFFLSYLIIELMVARSLFNLSKLVKYNILLIFSLLMLQGLAINYWDLLFHREIVTSAARWSFDRGILIHTDKNLAITFFFDTFLIFFFGYLYLYSRAIKGRFATIPGMEWLTDSVAFWLRIQTPTMRFGKKGSMDSNKSKKKEEDESEDEDNEDFLEDDTIDDTNE